MLWKRSRSGKYVNYPRHGLPASTTTCGVSIRLEFGPSRPYCILLAFLQTALQNNRRQPGEMYIPTINAIQVDAIRFRTLEYINMERVHFRGNPRCCYLGTPIP
jgi:hypothetical protein